MLQIDKVGSYFEDLSQYVERRFSLTADKYINLKKCPGLLRIRKKYSHYLAK